MDPFGHTANKVRHCLYENRWAACTEFTLVNVYISASFVGISGIFSHKIAPGHFTDRVYLRITKVNDWHKLKFAPFSKPLRKKSIIGCFDLSLSRISFCLVLFVLVSSSLFTRLLGSFIPAFVLHFQGSEHIDFENPMYGVHGYPSSDGTVERRGSNKVFYPYTYILFLVPLPLFLLGKHWVNVVKVVSENKHRQKLCSYNCHFLQYLRRRCSVYTWMRLDRMRRHKSSLRGNSLPLGSFSAKYSANL